MFCLYTLPLGTIHKRRLPRGGYKKCPKKRRSLVDLRRQGEGGYLKNLKFGRHLLWMVPYLFDCCVFISKKVSFQKILLDFDRPGEQFDLLVVCMCQQCQSFCQVRFTCRSHDHLGAIITWQTPDLSFCSLYLIFLLVKTQNKH